MPEGLPGRDVCWAAAYDFLDSGCRGQGLGWRYRSCEEMLHCRALCEPREPMWSLSESYESEGETLENIKLQGARGSEESLGMVWEREDDQERTVWKDISQ